MLFIICIGSNVSLQRGMSERGAVLVLTAYF